MSHPSTAFGILVMTLALAHPLAAEAARKKAAGNPLPAYPEIGREEPVSYSAEFRAELIERATKRRSSDRSPAATPSISVEKYIVKPLQGASTPDELEKVLVALTPGSTAPVP